MAELEENIITFDAHDPSICNAIPRLPFENFYPTHTILEELIENEDINISSVPGMNLYSIGYENQLDAVMNASNLSQKATKIKFLNITLFF